jgi:hypothetical protein
MANIVEEMTEKLLIDTCISLFIPASEKLFPVHGQGRINKLQYI